MIRFNFGLSSPFSYNLDTFSKYFENDFKISKNKHIYIDLYRNSIFNFISFGLNVDFTRDHGGIMFDVCLFGLNLDFEFYDFRHWDYINHKFIEGENK
jgi:hypothetical protein